MPLDVRAALTGLGWPASTVDSPQDLERGVRSFQQGCAHVRLAVDGVAGHRTQRALVDALHRRDAGKGTASPHFDYREWRCSCDGREAGCRGVLVHRELLTGLERYRSSDGDRPVRIVSGYRCPRRNAAVGGATDSQHRYGAAADLAPSLTVGAVLRLRAFSGVGDQSASGLVRHVDVRHVSGHNKTGGTPARPTRWHYA